MIENAYGIDSSQDLEVLMRVSENTLKGNFIFVSSNNKWNRKEPLLKKGYWKKDTDTKESYADLSLQPQNPLDITNEGQSVL